MKKDIRLRLPFYTMLGILMVSFALHMYFLIDHPGSNFIRIPTEQLEQMVEQGEIDEYTATLKEHTWKYGSRDAYLYVKMANQLLEHGVYGYDTHNTGEIVKNAFVTPGYPLILVGLIVVAEILNADQMSIIKLFNMFLSIGTVLLIFLIAKKLFPNPWIGVVASGIYAFYFPPLHYFRMALTEVPGIFFFCLSIYIFLIALETGKKRFHLLFAVFFCYTVLIRPVIAPLVMIGFIVLCMKHWRDVKKWIEVGLIWFAGALLVMGPWVIRNYIAFDEFILLSTHSGNSWIAGSNPYNLYDFRDYLQEMEKLGMDEKEYAHMKIMEGFQTDFGLWLSWFTVGKTYELFKIPDGIYFYSHWLLTYIKKIHQFLVILALITAIVSRKREVMGISAILVTYILFSNLFLTIPRYGFFITPIIFLLCGYAICTCLGIIGTKRWWRF